MRFVFYFIYVVVEVLKFYYFDENVMRLMYWKICFFIGYININECMKNVVYFSIEWLIRSVLLLLDLCILRIFMFCVEENWNVFIKRGFRRKKYV